MDAIVIIQEFDVNKQCHTCLSVDRKLKPIGEYVEIYKNIVPDYLHEEFTGPFGEDSVFSVLLCWECEAVLKKVQRFRSIVQRSRELRKFGQNYLPGSLSDLKSLLLNETHPNIIYINETNIQTDENHETNIQTNENHETDRTRDEKQNKTPVDSDDDNFELRIVTEEIKEEKNVVSRRKRKKTNWATKRAEENKRPKFKIVYGNDCFRKSLIDGDELNELKQTYMSKFGCENCSVGFEKRCTLIKHIKGCYGKISNNYVCDICKKIYTDKRHLTTHIQKHYDKYSCTVCPYICYNEEDIKTHINKNHLQVIECVKCGLKFRNRRDFYRHYKEWHERYICDVCGISFKMRYCIKNHIRSKHSPYECKPCNKRFARYGGLWLHKKIRHTESATRAYCVECDKSYPDEYRYKWHLNNSAQHRQPQPVKRIPCSACDKVFTKNLYMKDHYELVHLKNYKYRCEQCNKNFIRNADLTKHRRRVHEGILPPRNKMCDVCGRGFTTHKILSNHLRTHTGERPHACACGAAFAQRAALAAHARARGHVITSKKK